MCHSEPVTDVTGSESHGFSGRQITGLQCRTMSGKSVQAVSVNVGKGLCPFPTVNSDRLYVLPLPLWSFRCPGGASGKPRPTRENWIDGFELAGAVLKTGMAIINNGEWILFGLPGRNATLLGSVTIHFPGARIKNMAKYTRNGREKQQKRQLNKRKKCVIISVFRSSMPTPQK